MYCDLHTHSKYSDGRYTPTEIIKEAKEKGLVVALTDHNRTTGLREFTEAAEKEGVTAVAGVELSCDYKGVELHLLGLFIDPEHYEKVNDLTQKYIDLKIQSHHDMIKRFRDDGIIIDYEKVLAKGVDGNVNRVQFAEELMDMGLINSIEEGFSGLLKKEGKYYRPSPKLDFFDAVEFLCSINALPVLAHPLKELSAEELCQMLPEAIEKGLCGIEVIHSDYTSEKAEAAHKIAEHFDILKSGGSDFHGDAKPGLYLGTGRDGNVSVPIEFYEKLLEKKLSL